jgi:hypothetical protein
VCNTPKDAVKFRILEETRQITALEERVAGLLAELQNKCKHAEVVEHDRGSNNHSVRICTRCTLKEQAWVDELGMSNGFEKLIGAENRTIKQVSMSELAEYETLK